MKRRLLLSFAALILFAGFGHAAFADPLPVNPNFTLTLSNPNQTATPGQTLSFYGTIANTGSSVINIDADGFTFGGYAFVNPYTNPTCTGTVPCIDDSPFVNNAPFYLNPNSSYSGLLLYIDVPTTSSLGFFPSAYYIQGDSGGSAFSSTQSPFSTTVTPEPSSWLLMGTGLLALIVLARRTRFQQPVRGTLS